MPSNGAEDEIARLTAENTRLRRALDVAQELEAMRVARHPVVGDDAVPAIVIYTNWRGVTAVRRIVPRAVWYGTTPHHPEPQWFVRALDVDRDAERDFALRDFGGRGL